MSHELQRVLDAVSDEETFLCFLEALAADRADEVEKEKCNPSPPYGPGVNGWENGSIEAFLECPAGAFPPPPPLENTCSPLAG